MDSERFCLRWNDFQSNTSNAVKQFRKEGQFCDVTLACENRQIDAHKIILSACSPFFENILMQNPHQKPLIYMKGLHFNELLKVLDFIYKGEVSVSQDEINSFLSTAEELKIKGLSNKQSDEPQSFPSKKKTHTSETDGEGVKSVGTEVESHAAPPPSSVKSEPKGFRQ